LKNYGKDVLLEVGKKKHHGGGENQDARGSTMILARQGREDKKGQRTSSEKRGVGGEEDLSPEAMRAPRE